MAKKVALVGYGYLGQAYHRMFPDAIVYDEPKAKAQKEALEAGPVPYDFDRTPYATREEVNACDIALVAVPTDPLPDGSLNMSIVEEVADWLDTPLILFKSALMPGTVDRLVEKTGKKIAVSVEFIGMGNYYQPPHKYPDPKDPSKHDMIIVGGELDTATKCAEILWSKMSPDVKIHLVTAKEAELCKLLENTWGALKVTWANCFYNVVTKSGQNFIKVHQAWGADGRTEKMHTRVVSDKRGWKSHCYDKDIPALAAYAASVGATDLQRLVSLVNELNREHLTENE